jgi:hypothetical protein
MMDLETYLWLVDEAIWNHLVSKEGIENLEKLKEKELLL